MSDRVISSVGPYTGYTAAVSIDAANDYMLIQQSGVYKKVNRNTIFGVTGTPMDISTAQNVANKTLDNTNIFTIRRDRFTLQDSADTTKQAVFILSGITTATTRSYTLPNANVTLADTSTAQTLLLKTLTSPTITGGSISNSTISVDAIAEFTAANGVTIDSLNIKDGKLNTNNSVVTANVTDAAITPAKLIAGAGTGWTWQTWVPTLTNITLNNGTQIAKYTQIGKTIFFNWSLVMGTTSAIGTNPSITLPAASTANYLSNSKIGVGSFKAGTADGALWANINSTTAMSPVLMGAATTYVGPQGTITATVPGTWSGAAADYMNLSGFYEAA